MEKIVRYPSDNSIWRHKESKNEYIVMTVANLTATRADFKPTVVYRDMDNNVWARPLHEWHDKFEFVSNVLKSTIPPGATRNPGMIMAAMPAEALLRTNIDNVKDVLTAIERLGE
jgi:hypothetical protein